MLKACARGVHCRNCYEPFMRRLGLTECPRRGDGLAALASAEIAPAKIAANIAECERTLARELSPCTRRRWEQRMAYWKGIVMPTKVGCGKV